MKILIAQLNYIIGDFEGNTKKIISTITKARTKKIDLVVFSELCVCGYPPLDLLEHKHFIEKCNLYVNKIASKCVDVAAIVGAPSLNKNSKGKNLFNSAFFLRNGKIEQVIHKTLLPTYDIFDEYRYFEPNTSFSILKHENSTIALTICEDLWYQQPILTGFGKDKLYDVSPIEKLKKQNPDFIINISASPFSYTQESIKKKILTSNSLTFNLPIIYVNQVGANTELIFDGGSMIINTNGKIVKKLKSFEEDSYDFDTDLLFTKNTGIREQEDSNTIQQIHDALILGIRDYFQKMKFSKAVIGLSGGIDSAVTLVLSAKALGSHNIRVLLLPSKYSSEHSIIDAVALAKNLNVKYDIISIEKITAKFDNALGPLFGNLPSDITEENIQARIRGNLLMAVSNKFENILLNTSNKSEAAVGYGTLYGDMSGGLSVLGDVYKTDVYNLATFINRKHEIIPSNTISKPPSAELRPDQKDSDSLPDYSILDKILFNYIELKKPVGEIIELGIDKTIVDSIINLVNRNEYKRYQTPPILRISSKAFGTGRRMPLVARYF